MGTRILKTIIDYKVMRLSEKLDAIINKDYDFILEVCQSSGLESTEYLNYYREQLEKEVYQRVEEKNNGS